MKIHLVGISQEEADASLDEIGEIPDCCFESSSQLCKKPIAEMMIVQKPGSDWGENIVSTGACTNHLSTLHTIIAKVSAPA